MKHIVIFTMTTSVANFQRQSPPREVAEGSSSANDIGRTYRHSYDPTSSAMDSLSTMLTTATLIAIHL